MIVSGLTVLRNAVKLGYPFVESIKSVMPMCDEFIVVIGKGDDDTPGIVEEIGDTRIRIVETEWSEKISPRRYVISQQTNIGLHLCRGDWAVYLQANEMVHESDHERLRGLMTEHRDDDAVEALLMERLTFWGDYSHFLRVYPHRFKYSPRIVKPHRGVYSIRDGMSFGVFEGFSLRGRYPRSIDTGADLFRYGYVCSPSDLAGKDESAVHMVTMKGREFGDDFFFTAVPRSFVETYRGTHPQVMRERIERFEQSVSLDDAGWREIPTLKERQRLLETWFYRRFGVPSFRNTRYNLRGGYAGKERF